MRASLIRVSEKFSLFFRTFCKLDAHLRSAHSPQIWQSYTCYYIHMCIPSWLFFPDGGNRKILSYTLYLTESRKNLYVCCASYIDFFFVYNGGVRGRSRSGKEKYYSKFFFLSSWPLPVLLNKHTFRRYR